MRLLLIHADRFSYRITQKTPVAEPLPAGSEQGGSTGPALVVFLSVEKVDGAHQDQAVAAATKVIGDAASEVKADTLVLYPYAHLSSDLAPPATAVAILQRLRHEVGALPQVKVHNAPFGWYKAFDIACKGHPLSERSRTLGEAEYAKVGHPAGAAQTREEVVASITSRLLILLPDGREHPLPPADAIEEDPLLAHYPPLRTLVLSEVRKGVAGKEPPSIKAMQSLELVDYEPASDSGHFRLYPKGALVFDLLRQWATDIARDRLGCVQIETPILYDWAQPDINEQAKSFHERHYRIITDEGRTFVLRFAGDFGLFRMLGDATLSYRNLPLRVYEFSKSFRFEQRGELSGLKRLRAFHMPDIHCFTADVPSGWDEYRLLYDAYDEFVKDTGISYAIAFRVVDSFYREHKDRIVAMLASSGQPALIEVLSEMKHYWAVKHEFNGIDSVGGCLQLSTVQLDVMDAERYGITYTDSTNTERGCIICHSSIGSIERWMYAILEHALKKDKPALPLWLSPTQVRVLPVKSEHVAACVQMAEELLPLRVEVDDRDESIGKKIREAEQAWVNAIVVFGDKEVGGAALPVRWRGTQPEQLTLPQLRKRLLEMVEGYPSAPLALPRLLSKQPTFRG